MVAWWMTGVLAWLVAQAITALDQAGDIWPDSLLTAPDVTVLPQVIALADRSRWVVNTAYVLALVVAGIIAMTYESVQVRYSVKELAPRLIVGFVAANMAVPLCQQLLVIANALTQALADQSITGHAMIAMLSDHIAAATQDGATSFLLVLVTLLIVVLVFTLLFHWITRIGVLIILVAVAPVALACYALPQLEGAARFWWRTMLGALGTQVLQVVAVVSGLKVFLDPDVNLPVIIGLPATVGLSQMPQLLGTTSR